LGGKWLKTVKVDLDDFPPGCLHDGECRYEREGPIPEEDDFCPGCEQEHYECSGEVMDKLDKEDFDIWDIMLVNRPGLGPDEDRFWEWEVLVSRRK